MFDPNHLEELELGLRDNDRLRDEVHSMREEVAIVGSYSKVLRGASKDLVARSKAKRSQSRIG